MYCTTWQPTSQLGHPKPMHPKPMHPKPMHPKPMHPKPMHPKPMHPNAMPQIELERAAKEAVSREKGLVEQSLAAEQRLAEAMRKVGRGGAPALAPLRALLPEQWGSGLGPPSPCCPPASQPGPVVPTGCGHLPPATAWCPRTVATARALEAALAALDQTLANACPLLLVGCGAGGGGDL